MSITSAAMPRRVTATPEGLELGRRLRALRKRHGLTQQAAATALGVTTSTVQYWEHGQVSTIRQGNRESLAALWGGEPADYLPAAPAELKWREAMEARVAAIEEALRMEAPPPSDEAAAAIDHVVGELEDAAESPHSQESEPPQTPRAAAKRNRA